ncbi:YceI family protein [Flavobacterium sp. CS20]|uniref:YceI family protein n=1 Tax=Flavobacterium sp. CS20 TaxID=2775246 RepID=UPI001B3A4B6D|nr:YceI family protein [Flavobacterium sp. CS20]QTY26169.1 YceI family protein [Flavobacterium sp. CS20]
MKTYKTPRIILLSLFFLGFFYAEAQSNYEIDKEASEILVDGTSNLHDWTIEVNTLEGKMLLDENQNIKSLSLNIPVKGLESGKKSMNKNTYEALKEEEHPNIFFKLDKLEKKDNNDVALGKLSIAGHTENVSIPIQFTGTEGNKTIKAEYTINMVDYGVEPPTALFGSIKTGETVTVKVNLIYRNQ